MLEMCFNCDYCEEQNGDYFCTNNESEYVGDYVEKGTVLAEAEEDE